jgi:beta-glucosidase
VWNEAEGPPQMSSYNRVNGVHAAEHPHLLRKILRGDWGFKGLIMSDWSGTYSSSEAVKAGLDEMPGPAFMRGVCVERDIVSGKLTPGDVDDCVGRVLDYVQNAKESGIAFEAEEKSLDTPEVRALLREAADAGVVLLKNSAGVLPLVPKQGTKIAVIGPNAKSPAYSGGGSANLAPTYTVTPYDAILKVANEVGATVECLKAADTERWLPLLTPYITLPGNKVGAEPGVMSHFYDAK